MKHLTLDELDERLHVAAQNVVVGGRYRHYKGNYYTVTQLAILEATNEPVVIYRADYDARISFVRPVTSWLEKVDIEGVAVTRFTLEEDAATLD